MQFPSQCDCPDTVRTYSSATRIAAHPVAVDILNNSDEAEPRRNPIATRKQTLGGDNLRFWMEQGIKTQTPDTEGRKAGDGSLLSSKSGIARIKSKNRQLQYTQGHLAHPGPSAAEAQIPLGVWQWAIYSLRRDKKWGPGDGIRKAGTSGRLL